MLAAYTSSSAHGNVMKLAISQSERTAEMLALYLKMRSLIIPNEKDSRRSRKLDSVPAIQSLLDHRLPGLHKPSAGRKANFQSEALCTSPYGAVGHVHQTISTTRDLLQRIIRARLAHARGLEV